MTYQDLLAALTKTAPKFAATLTTLSEEQGVQRLRSALMTPTATVDQLSEALNGLNVGRSLDNAAATLPSAAPVGPGPNAKPAPPAGPADGAANSETAAPVAPPRTTEPTGDSAATLQDRVDSVAPALGALLAGALRTTAMQALGRVVVGDSEAGESAILAKLSDAAWEDKVKEAQAAALKQISSEANSLEESRLAYQDLDRSRAALAEAQKRDDQDRGIARERQKTARDWWINPTLALLVTAGFFWMLWLVLLPDPDASDPSPVATTMLGVLGTTWVAVMSFYFGSSTGSKEKTKILSRQLEAETEAANPAAAH